jgi:hypothetical protein
MLRSSCSRNWFSMRCRRPDAIRNNTLAATLTILRREQEQNNRPVPCRFESEFPRTNTDGAFRANIFIPFSTMSQNIGFLYQLLSFHFQRRYLIVLLVSDNCLSKTSRCSNPTPIKKSFVNKTREGQLLLLSKPKTVKTEMTRQWLC